MSHGWHVHYGLQSPSPSGYALGVADFIIHNALPTMQYLLHTNHPHIIEKHTEVADWLREYSLS